MDQISSFSTEKALNLVHTTGPEDGFYTIMACHHSPVGREFPCAGYLAAEGIKNIGVRLLASWGQIDLRAVQVACEGEDLHSDFASMLISLVGEEAAYPPLIGRGLISEKELLKKSC